MIGSLRHRLTIQQPVREADEGGGFETTWEDIDDNPAVFAAIHPVGAGENLRFHKLESRVTHRIRIRHRADITAEMRFSDGDKVYNILSAIDEDGRGKYLEIMAEMIF